MTHGSPSDSESAPAARWRVTSALALLALFIGLAIVHTWPLASAPGRLSRNDTADTVLHEWIMAWVAHQIVTDPWHLFDANIFYPERRTLAYSDHLFVQSMLGAPLLWSGASPVLVHNLVLIAGFALTAWTTSLVVRRWTGNTMAGVLSGSLVAFNSFTLTRLPQIQDLHAEFFPLTLFALDRLLRFPRVRHALQLAGWYILQSLTGTYLMVFTTISLIAAIAARPREWITRWRTLIPLSVMAAVVSMAALTPFLLPYYFASEHVGLGRSLDETQRYSAELTDYLAAAGTFHFNLWSRPFFAGDALFPGITALALAGCATAMTVMKDSRVRMLLVIGAVAFAFSFGPAFPPYRWLYRVFPLLTGIRGAVRFGQITLIAIGLLAGFGLASIQRRTRRVVSATIAAVVLVTGNGEALRAPMWYSEYGGIPPVYDALEQIGRKSVLVWFPFYGSAQFHQNAPFMLVSTRGWHRMLNGYSGFKPASYYEHVERLSTFPDRSSIGYLQQLGVTHVLVDSRHMRPHKVAELAAFSELHLWVTDGNLRIYVLSST